MAGPVKDNVTRRETWQRLLYIVLFAFIYTVAEIVLAAVVVVQFGFELIAGRRNRSLLELGAGLARYAYEILLYVTYNTERRPYPFAEWPHGAPSAQRAARGTRRSGGRGAARKKRAQPAPADDEQREDSAKPPSG